MLVAVTTIVFLFKGATETGEEPVFCDGVGSHGKHTVAVRNEPGTMGRHHKNRQESVCGQYNLPFG